MGQRTNIILQHINKEEKKTTTRVFYCQWGIGRILPSQLVSILNATLTCSSYWSDFAAQLKPQGTLDVTDEWYTEKAEKALLESLDFSKPEDVGRVMKDGNNNGGIFVRIQTGKFGKETEIEYAYMLGCEEDGNYKSFCTAEKWMSHHPRYIDDGFKDYYKRTLDYYGAKEYKPTKKGKGAKK